MVRRSGKGDGWERNCAEQVGGGDEILIEISKAASGAEPGGDWIRVLRERSGSRPDPIGQCYRQRHYTMQVI